MTLFELLTLAAGTWYLAYCITATHGPWGVFEKLREFKGGRWHGRSKPVDVYTPNKEMVAYVQKYQDGLLDCIICTSVWVAFALCMLRGHNDLIDAFAVAGIALLLHGFTGWRINM